MKVIFLIPALLAFNLFNMLAQEAGITNPADGLIINRYNFDTYITDTRTCSFDGWANPGNIDIRLYVNTAQKNFNCNNCGTWNTTQTIDAGTNEIYLESRKDFDPWVESSNRTITFMKPLNASDFYLQYPDDEYVRITWFKHTATGTSGFYYRVYRNTVDEAGTGDDWVVLGEWTQDNVFDDHTAEVGTTYYYWVVCASNNIGSNPSAFGTSRETTVPFPVELTLFKVEMINDVITLKWQTSTEINNYGFEIERSSSSLGTIWETIGFVNGNGNSNSPKEYSFVDRETLNGEVKYRLKQIDNDGDFEYSDIMTINLDAPTKYGLSYNFPNPFNPSTTIRFSVPQSEHVKLIVYDVLGREIAMLVNEVKDPGSYEVNFDASNLSSGVYIYRLTTEANTIERKMLLLK